MMKNKFRGRAVVLCVMALVAVLQGCNRFAEPTYEPVTVEEVTEFAKGFKVSFDDQNRAYFVACSDHRRLSWRGLDGEYSGTMLDKFTEGVRKGFSMPDYFTGQGVSEFTDVYLFGPAERDGHRVLRLRASTEEGEVAYMDLLLEKRTDDVDSRVVITDLFFYNLGDWMSAAMAENMKRSGMMDLDDIDDESQENIETIERITDLYNEGRIDAAEEMWEELPQDLRGSKSILVSRLMNLPGHDSAAYVKARAEFEENYPNDEATMSLDVNTSFANFDYESAYAAVQRMKPLLGGIDGYQYYLHAYALMGLDRNAEALEMAEKAVELEPGLPFIREMLLDCLIAAGKYERAVEELQLLMDLEFVTTAEIGMSDEKFYESAAFVEFRKKDPETWSFLDEEYDDEDWGDEVWEDE